MDALEGPASWNRLARSGTRTLGWLAFAGVAMFPFLIKGGSWAMMITSLSGAGLCLLGGLVYGGCGRLWWTEADPAALRKVFQGYVLGTRTIFAILAFTLLMVFLDRSN